MKKILITVSAGVILLGSSVVSRAEEIKNNIQLNLNQTTIDAFTQDMGALVSGGSFHTGKALGFPVGFDVGVHANWVTLQDEDGVLKDDGSSWGSAFAQAEVGLPAKFNLIGRVGTLGDGNIYGGGLRYGLLKSDIPGIPSISLTALYNTFDHDFIEFKNYSVNAALSFDLPIIRPYIGAGYDFNKLEVKNAAYVGAPGSATPNLESDESGYRAEAGINLSVIPFTYITAAVGVANGEPTYHAGLGVTF